MTFVLRLSNSGLRRATEPSSVVQTGVKSFGCENSTPQELPSHSWKRTGPSVVCASKSGARELIGSDMEVSNSSPVYPTITLNVGFGPLRVLLAGRQTRRL